MTRAEGNQYKKWRLQPVYISDPAQTSPASLVLLSRKYYLIDKSIFDPRRMMKLRDRWMKKMMLNADDKGGLTCAICGRQGLLPFTHSRNINNMATLDHITPISEGGSWNDEANFQVACYQCNANKEHNGQLQTA